MPDLVDKNTELTFGQTLIILFILLLVFALMIGMTVYKVGKIVISQQKKLINSFHGISEHGAQMPPLQ